MVPNGEIYKRRNVAIFLSISLTFVLGAQKNRLIETLFEYPQLMFW